MFITQGQIAVNSWCHYTDTTHSNIMYLCMGHSATRHLEGGKQTNKSTENDIERRSCQSKKWCLSHKLFYILFSITQSFLLGFSWSSDITGSNKKEHIQERFYQCIWNKYIIFAKIYYNSTTSSMWVVYTYMCV